MKSIKPGRGPSMMGGIMSIAVGLFGIVWTAMAADAGGMFALFGVIFIGIAVASAIYNFKNATGKNRYSTYDITDAHEEPDPLNERYGGQEAGEPPRAAGGGESAFCPYCGARAEDDFEFCNKCGRKLP